MNKYYPSVNSNFFFYDFIIKIFILISLIVIFFRFFTPISYDLIFYKQYYELTINSLEPGFKFLFHNLSNIGVPFKLGLYVLPFLWSVIVYYKFKPNFSNNIFFIFIVIMFSSQFFTLGILNAVRQFYSTLFILLLFFDKFFTISKKEKILYFLVSISLHWSSIFMFPFIYFLKFLSKERWFYFRIITASGIAFFLFYAFNYIFIKDKYLSDFVEQERSSALLKLFVITVYYFCTFILIRNEKGLIFEQRIRFSLYLFLLLFSGYGELFSRFLYFFSGFEVFFFFNILILNSFSHSRKIIYTFLFFSYNFLSLNVINVFWKGLTNYFYLFFI